MSLTGSDALLLSEQQCDVHGGSHRRAGDFPVIEDETKLSRITEALCLKPQTYITHLRNLHLPARLQSYYCQRWIKHRTLQAVLKHLRLVREEKSQVF